MVLGLEEQGLAKGGWREVFDGAEPGKGLIPVAGGGAVMRLVRCEERVKSNLRVGGSTSNRVRVTIITVL